MLQTPLRSGEKGIPPKLHVLTLTPFFPSEADDASGCFVAEPLRQLQDMGVTSSVIAVDSIYHSRRTPSQDYPADWIRYPRLPGHFGLSSAGRLLGPFLLKKVLQLHRRSTISVIHAHSALPCGDAAAFLSQRLRIPFVVTVHGLDVFNSCGKRDITTESRRKVSMKVYEKAQKIICVSEKIRQLLRNRMAADVAAEVVYNGTDTTLFAPSTMVNETQTLLTVGNLIAVKGHELVLRAIHGMKNSHPGLRCNIIGEGIDRSRLEQLAMNLGISDRVFFLGRRSRSEVAEAMRNSTIFALPSGYEGLGCVYLEAMASGKPAIACQGQGIDEIIRHGYNGWLIPVGGLEALTQGLQTLLCDAELRAQIGQAARRTILEKLTLSHQVQHLTKIFVEAANNRISIGSTQAAFRAPAGLQP